MPVLIKQKGIIMSLTAEEILSEILKDESFTYLCPYNFKRTDEEIEGLFFRINVDKRYIVKLIQGVEFCIEIYNTRYELFTRVTGVAVENIVRVLRYSISGEIMPKNLTDLEPSAGTLDKQIENRSTDSLPQVA